MAAVLVFPTESEWVVIEPFLEACKEGALVVTPLQHATFQRLAGGPIDTYLKNYDFGGQADLSIDVVHDLPDWGTREEAVEELEKGESDSRTEAACAAFGLRPSWWQQ
jgi:hypothetical protein